MDSPKPKRRWFRFSLRTLLIVTALAGLLMGWIVKERTQSQREHEIADKLTAQYGAMVTFSGAFDNPSQLVEQPWWRLKLGSLLGTRVSDIQLGDSSISDITPLSQFTNLEVLVLNRTKVSDLTPLVELRKLRGLWITDSPVSDLLPLVALKNLRRLELSKTNVVDLTPLTELENLRDLHLENAQSLDISPLARLKNLQFIDIESAQFTEKQIESLQRALPGCLIYP